MGPEAGLIGRLEGAAQLFQQNERGFQVPAMTAELMVMFATAICVLKIWIKYAGA